VWHVLFGFLSSIQERLTAKQARNVNARGRAVITPEAKRSAKMISLAVQAVQNKTAVP